MSLGLHVKLFPPVAFTVNDRDDISIQRWSGGSDVYKSAPGLFTVKYESEYNVSVKTAGKDWNEIGMEWAT